MTNPTPKQRRGFALLPAARMAQVASTGGQASQRSGHGRQWTRKQAQEAARHSVAVRNAPVWTSSDGRVSLRVLLADALDCSAGGRDALPYVADLMRKPYIARQLAKVSPQDVRAALRPYGAWSEYELRDHAQNLQRILWVACGDIRESYRG